jgi:branched-chain amino acid transport system ATP-binding protein
MLKVKDLNVRYGGIHAVRGIDFDVPVGSIVTLIGANGAGKSSSLRAICNLVKKSGNVPLWDKIFPNTYKRYHKNGNNHGARRATCLQ